MAFDHNELKLNHTNLLMSTPFGTEIIIDKEVFYHVAEGWITKSGKAWGSEEVAEVPYHFHHIPYSTIEGWLEQYLMQKIRPELATLLNA